jgi:hypothetical protein
MKDLPDEVIIQRLSAATAALGIGTVATIWGPRFLPYAPGPHAKIAVGLATAAAGGFTFLAGRAVAKYGYELLIRLVISEIEYRELMEKLKGPV